MAVKKIKTQVKLQLNAGEATPAPPLGPTLGQHGVPIMDFVKQYNEKTADQRGNIVPVLLTIYEDRTFDFETKLPPVGAMIKKEVRLDKGSGTAGKGQVATMTKDQVRKIAEAKLADLNTTNVESAMNTVEGTARSMGVKIQD